MNGQRLIILLCSIFFSISVCAQGKISRPTQQPHNMSSSSTKVNDNTNIISKFNWDNDGICQDTIVDLGLSVNWAGWNIGANSPDQEGTLFGWGDPSGKERSIYSAKYPVKDPPMSICGDSRYDMAMVNWGWPWRLPNRKELDELVSKCKWEEMYYHGIKGFKLTVPNGNTLFLPITRSRTPIWDKDKQDYKDELETKQSSTGHYYSGELNSNGGKWEPWDCRPYVLCCFGGSIARGSVDGTTLRCTGYPVRAVYDK